jgi:hypothetical protein
MGSAGPGSPNGGGTIRPRWPRSPRAHASRTSATTAPRRALTTAIRLISYLMWTPEMLRAMMSRWISEVPSKMV